MSTHTRDYNNNGSRMQPQHEAFRASVPWPPKDASVAVAVQRWRRTYIQYHHEHGDIDIVPANIEYDVKMQLAGAAVGTGDDSREIIVRWSHIKALHAALAPGWPRARAAGYTKNMSDKLAAGKDTAFLWGSSLKADLADKRLSIIGPYLEALLAEPRLHTNPLVTAFLARAQAFADSCNRATMNNVTTTAPSIPKAPANADAEETDSTAAAAPTTTTATTVPEESSITSAHPASSTASPTDHRCSNSSSSSLQGKDLQVSANQKVCALGVSDVLLDETLPLVTATEKEEKIMDVIQLLLIDGRLMAPYLTTQDLRQFSQTRQAWRSVQQERLHRTIVKKWDQIRDARIGALPLHAFRRRAARQDHQDAGWDPLFSALEQGKARNLQSLNTAVQPRDFDWRPRLTCASACRLAASLSYMPSLLHLFLPGNKIGTAGALALADGLQHTPHLRTLHLGASNIGDEGIEAIACVLPKVPELECLALGRHYMRHPAAKQLAPSLKYVPRLKHLAFGRYCWDGMEVLERLTDLPALGLLEMARALTPEVIELLGQQLPLLPKLSKLVLVRTHLHEGTIREFATMVMSVLSIKYISISASPFELTAKMCIEFKCTLEARGFQEIDSVPGQMDAQRKAQDLEFDRTGRVLNYYSARVLSLRRS